MRAGTFEEIGAEVSLTSQYDGFQSAFRIRSILHWLCLTSAGTSEINDSSSRVNPAAPKCPHQFRENGGLFCCPVFDGFREQNRIETSVTSHSARHRWVIPLAFAALRKVEQSERAEVLQAGIVCSSPSSPNIKRPR